MLPADILPFSPLQEFLPVTPVMEGTVILTPNPDYKPPRVEEEREMIRLTAASQ